VNHVIFAMLDQTAEESFRRAAIQMLAADGSFAVDSDG
jgi:hypothetical protein